MRGVVLAEMDGFEPRDASAWLSPKGGGAPPTTAQEVLVSPNANCGLFGSTTIPARAGSS